MIVSISALHYVLFGYTCMKAESLNWLIYVSSGFKLIHYNPPSVKKGDMVSIFNKKVTSSIYEGHLPKNKFPTSFLNTQML